MNPAAPEAAAARRCLVLGGSGFLGREICRALAAAGAAVGFTWHAHRQAAEELLAEIPGSRGWPLDLESVADTERLIDEAGEALGGLEALVHAAALGIPPGREPAGGGHQPLDEVSERDWDLLLAVNARSAFFACRRAASWLRRAGGGNLVLIGSIDGVKPVPAPPVYAASKAAVSGMARALAKALGPENIRVNVVAPGVLEGGLSRTLPPELREEYRRHCGLRRLGRPAEAAAVAAWLALENTYVTGQTLVVDGAL